VTTWPDEDAYREALLEEREELLDEWQRRDEERRARNAAEQPDEGENA
jgi:hypothetical protein